MVSAVVAGILVGAGLAVAVAGSVGTRRGESTPHHAHRVRPLDRGLLLRALASAVCALVALMVTGWVVGAIAAGVGAALVPSALAEHRRRGRERSRVEAVATWTEMLRDALSSGRGLHEALATTAPLAPVAIREAALALRARAVRGSLPGALRAFADEVGDPMADLVAAALTLSATREVAELSGLLSALARTTRDQAALRLTVESGRASLRSSASAIGAIAALVVVGLLVFAPSYLAPYESASGQLALAVALSWFAAGAFGLARLGRPPKARRLHLRLRELVR